MLYYLVFKVIEHEQRILVDMWTNNKCERYNDRLAKRALKANVDVYELILLFKEEQRGDKNL